MTPSTDEVRSLDTYFRAANCVTVGQIYLQANALLRERLRPEDIKPRLLGHWGTSPGWNLVYAHVNRLIRSRDVNAIFLPGPAHGGPAHVYIAEHLEDMLEVREWTRTTPRRRVFRPPIVGLGPTSGGDRARLRRPCHAPPRPRAPFALRGADTNLQP
jgi:hypothetical protein